MDPDLVLRAAQHAALGDPVRLAIVDTLVHDDRSPTELGEQLGISSNLLAHHLDVLERAGMVRRTPSSGDGRRRYVHLVGASAPTAVPRRPVRADRVVFVCTHNSARSPLGAALWQRATGMPALSAGTHPAPRVHPGAVATARRAGLDLTGVQPRSLRELGIVTSDDQSNTDLVITVCDQAHEEVGAANGWLHWSVPDPVAVRTRAGFDAARDDLQERIESLATTSGLRG